MNTAPDLDEYRCPRCKLTKPRNAYGGRTKRNYYCKPCQATVTREWRRRNKTLHAAALRREALARFGLTREVYDELCQAQGGKCAICGIVPDHELAVDHDHDSGLIRGLLCKRCNVGLGYFKDNATVLRRAANYTANPPAAARGLIAPPQRNRNRRRSAR